MFKGKTTAKEYESVLDLTIAQLYRLRKDVVLNSCYGSDYENRYGIDTDDVYTFFDGYCSYLEELMLEDGYTDDDFYDVLKKYDTPSNLRGWRYCFAE